MGRYYERKLDGSLGDSFAVQQDPPVEYIDDASPEFAALALGAAKRDKAAAIAAAYAAAIARGCAHRGKVIQLDAESRGNIGALAAVAELAEEERAEWPAMLESKGWRTLDNTHLPVTPAQMLELSLAAMAQFVAIRFRASALKDALAVAATVAEVNAIDATAGWPGEA